MSGIRVPTILVDLYRDLRDKRLLAPVAALLAALVAVPVVLAQSSEPPPPSTQPVAVEATAASPAVMAEATGIRDYRKRLEALKRKNPFDQQYTGAASGEGEITEPESGGEVTSVTGGDEALELEAGGETAGEGGGSTPPAPPPGPRVERLWYTWEVGVLFGPPGDASRHDDLRALDPLPSRRDAVAVLFGVAGNGKRATFALTHEVSAVDGDGACAPSRASCEFLTLRPGEEARITVAPDAGPEASYRLKLIRIAAKQVSKPAG